MYKEEKRQFHVANEILGLWLNPDLLCKEARIFLNQAEEGDS